MSNVRTPGELVPVAKLDGLAVRPAPFAVGHFVTAAGRVLSTERGSAHPRERRAILSNRGYLMIYVHSIGRSVAVHAFVAAAFLPPRPSPAHQIRHLDGNPLNNRATNLQWGTAQENADDKKRHGTIASGVRNGAYTKPHRVRRGESNGRAILTMPQVANVRLRLVAGELRADIARNLGVRWNVIDRIARGVTWQPIAEEDARRTANGHGSEDSAS